MGAFLGISLWIALATVVPGLVTIAVVYGAFTFVTPETLSGLGTLLPHRSDWLWAAVAVTIMVLTQEIGILVEWVLVRYRLLCKESEENPEILILPEGFDPLGETHIAFKPYDHYHGLYILIAQLREDEDAHGHLKRALAQFFLTNNTLVSFMAGIGISVALILFDETAIACPNGIAYIATLVSCLLMTYMVARNRFRVMAMELLAANRARQKRESDAALQQKAISVNLNVISDD